MQTDLGLIKCHKCRHVLINELKNYVQVCDLQMCSSYNLRNFIYVPEDQLPDWIKSKVEEEQWTKGKLHCVNCKSKIGSFDFISGRKCDCQSSLLPPVHFIGSQVDRPMLTNVFMNNKPSFQ
jgi:E3 ubiquitin-protein ligase RNF180